MRIHLEGALADGFTAKDMILSIIGEIGTAGGTGHVIEYAGEAVRSLTMEGRMTLCNMSIEAGARAGLVAPDDKTYAYLEGRPMAPKGAVWEKAVLHWKMLPTDKGASFDEEIRLDVSNLPPLVSWGTSPQDVVKITGSVPDPSKEKDAARRRSDGEGAWLYGLEGGGKDDGDCCQSRLHRLLHEWAD